MAHSLYFDTFLIEIAELGRPWGGEKQMAKKWVCYMAKVDVHFSLLYKRGVAPFGSPSLPPLFYKILYPPLAMEVREHSIGDHVMLATWNFSCLMAIHLLPVPEHLLPFPCSGTHSVLYT